MNISRKMPVKQTRGKLQKITKLTIDDERRRGKRKRERERE